MNDRPSGAALSTGAIREKVVRIYTSLVPGGQTAGDDEHGALDSMAFLEFIMSIEREFEIVVEVSDLDEVNFATTAATIAFLERKLAEPRP